MKNEWEGPREALRRLPSGSRLLCAVSGGLDSMCLLHWMAGWGREQGFFVAAGHFNHRLRGEAADGDEAFVREICGQWGVPFAAGSGDTRGLMRTEGLSMEEAARRLRYDFLRRTAEQLECGWILTAHTADDQAETVLLNLIRGTGTKGLTGIPACRDNLLRPFLTVSRAELETYAAACGVPHREDETNADPEAASRNFLRLRVMPLLRELNPRAAEHIGAAAGQLCLADRMIEDEAVRRTAGALCGPGRVSLNISPADWRRVPEAVHPRMLLRLLEQLGTGRKDVGTVHLEALDAMLCRGGGRLDLPHGAAARYDRGRLTLERSPLRPERTVLQPGRPLRWGKYILTLLDHAEGPGLALKSDPAEAGAEIAAASCRGGDRLTLPETNGGARTVKRLCLDRHISPGERDALPAVWVGQQLAAVWRLGVDEHFLPAGEGCRFIQIINETEEKDYEK